MMMVPTMAFPKPAALLQWGRRQLGKQSETELLPAAPDQHQQNGEERDQGEQRHSSYDPAQNDAEERPRSIERELKLGEINARERICVSRFRFRPV